MTRIAVISDIHGNILALEKVVQDIKRRGVDQVVNLGDHVSGPLWAKETIQFLMEQSWIQIRGNHDRQLVSQASETHGASDKFAFQQLNENELDWLRKLPPQAELLGEILFVHGTPKSDSTYLLETIVHGSNRIATRSEIKERIGDSQHKLILCGHTHIPRVVAISEQTTIINPGSVGLQAYDDTSPEYHVMQTGSPHARYVILEKVDMNWAVNLLHVEYDHNSAAARAHKNERLEWEYALRTGLMP